MRKIIFLLLLFFKIYSSFAITSTQILTITNKILEDSINFSSIYLKTTTDFTGVKHHHVQINYMGVTIYGGALIFHENANGEIDFMTGQIPKIDNLSVNPTVSQNDAFNIAVSEVNANQYIWNTGNTSAPVPELYIFNKNNRYFLGYKLLIEATDPFKKRIIIIDAHTGNIEINRDAIMGCTNGLSIVGTAQTKYSGQVNDIRTQYDGSNFILQNLDYGIFLYEEQSTNPDSHTDSDNVWNINTGSANDYAIDVLYGLQKSVEFFCGLTNGSDFYIGINAVNNSFNALSYGAMYNPYANNGYGEFHFSDGSLFHAKPFTSPSTVGHEFGHLVDHKKGNLLSAINQQQQHLLESFSDIMGVAVDKHAKALNQPNYVIGEDEIATNTGDFYSSFILRNLADPKSQNKPNTYLGQYWDFNDNGYTNLGVQNFWFYLLAEGGVGTNDNGANYNVNGIGFENAVKIIYMAYTYYISPSYNYQEVRDCTIKAAMALFGECDSKVQSVADAWHAVGVGNQEIENANFTVQVQNIGGWQIYFKALGSIITNNNNPVTFTWYVEEVGNPTNSTTGSHNLMPPLYDYFIDDTYISFNPCSSYDITLSWIGCKGQTISKTKRVVIPDANNYGELQIEVNNPTAINNTYSGNTINLDFTISNVGFSQMNNYSVTAQVFDATGTISLSQSQNIISGIGQSLPVGTHNFITFWTVPTNLTSGNYIVRLFIDSQDKECNQLDNFTEIPFSIACNTENKMNFPNNCFWISCPPQSIILDYAPLHSNGVVWTIENIDLPFSFFTTTTFGNNKSYEIDDLFKGLTLTPCERYKLTMGYTDNCSNLLISDELIFTYYNYFNYYPFLTHKVGANIASNTTWNGLNEKYSGSIFVRSGATLTIKNSTLEFVSHLPAQIKVEPGAKLIIDNSVITSMCFSELWHGIEIIANPSATSTMNPLHPNNPQGVVVVKNGSTISNTKKGIYAYYGGQIEATNSNFINNRVAIRSANRPDAYCYIKECIFETNNAFPGRTPGHNDMTTFIQLDDSKAQIVGNTFRNLNNDYKFERDYGTGIFSKLSQTTVVPLYKNAGNGSSSQTPKPKNIEAKNTFIGLSKGIDHYAQGGLDDVLLVDFAVMQDVFNGITSNSGRYDEITNCHITTSGNRSAKGVILPADDRAYGVFMNNCDDYLVAQDTIEKGSFGHTRQYGIVTRIPSLAYNTDAPMGEVYRNDVTEEISIQAEGNNFNTTVECNTMSSYEVGIRLIDTQADVGTIDGVFDDMGDCDPATITEPAGNKFDPCVSGARQLEDAGSVQSAFEYSDFPNNNANQQCFSPNVTVIQCSNPNQCPSLEDITQTNGNPNSLRTKIDNLPPGKEKEKLRAKLMRMYLHDNNITDAENYLATLTSDKAKKIRVIRALERKDFANCLAELNNIPNTGIENQAFHSLYGMLLTACSNGKVLNQLTATERVVLEQVKQTPTQAGSIAEVLLAQIDEEQIQRIPEDIATTSPVARTQNEHEDKLIENEVVKFFKLVPNPAQGFVNVHFNSPVISGSIYLIDIVTGKTIEEIEIAEEISSIELNTSNLENGTYLVQYKNMYEKLVIIK